MAKQITVKRRCPICKRRNRSRHFCTHCFSNGMRVDLVIDSKGRRDKVNKKKKRRVMKNRKLAAMCSR